MSCGFSILNKSVLHRDFDIFRTGSFFRVRPGVPQGVFFRGDCAILGHQAWLDKGRFSACSGSMSARRCHGGLAVPVTQSSIPSIQIHFASLSDP